MAGPTFDEQVEAFVLELVRPKQLREPRRADRLVDIEPATVASTVGDLAVWRIGEGPAVLLVHGWEDDHSLWSPLIDALADRGKALIAFDLPAHGVSGGDWGLGSEATRAIETIAETCGPIESIVAHSFGCGAASLAITDGVRVARAVFIAPPMRSGNRWQRYADRLGVPTEVAAAAEQAYLARHPPSHATWRARDALPRLDLELLVVHSVDDERNPYSDSAEVVPLHPRGDLLTVRGLTHRRTARDPEVVRGIADFVCATPVASPKP